MPDQTPDKPSSAARLNASKALAGRCTARLRAPESENIPVWLGGTYVYSERPTREKLPTTCKPQSTRREEKMMLICRRPYQESAFGDKLPQCQVTHLCPLDIDV